MPSLLRSEEHTSELQSLRHLVCRLLLEKKKIENSSSLSRHRVLVSHITSTPICRSAGGFRRGNSGIALEASYGGLAFFFFFNDTATTEIYTLSLHDALPISDHYGRSPGYRPTACHRHRYDLDRKSTRLNSSHLGISYAVFCLKKKKSNN